jgi:hypothetical protein
MGAQRTWTNLLFLILRQISQMYTDKTDSMKQDPSLPLIRAGREIRGQNSFSTCMRKGLPSDDC